MALVWNYEFRKHFRQLKREENGERGSGGVSARFDILFLLTLHADEHGRCWPKVRTLAQEAGCSEATATAAMDWLREHEAFCNVPYPHRLPSEKNLPISKQIYQLTGFMRFGSERVYYLYVNPDTLSRMERNFERYTADSSAVEETDSSAPESSGNESSTAEGKVFPVLEVSPEEEVSPQTEPFRAGEAGAPTAAPPQVFSFDRNADAPVDPPDTGSGSGHGEEELPDQRTELEKVLCGLVGRKTISAQAVEVLNTHSSTQGGPAEAQLPSPNRAYDQDPLYFRWVNESRLPFFVQQRTKNPKEWTSLHLARYLRATYGAYQEWAEKHEVGEPDRPAPSPAAPPPPSKIGAKDWFQWEDDPGEGEDA